MCSILLALLIILLGYTKNISIFDQWSFQRKTYKRIGKETRKDIILLFNLFKLKLVVVEFPIQHLKIVEFTTIFIIKFLSGMSLPRVLRLQKLLVPIYISRKCLTLPKMKE